MPNGSKPTNNLSHFPCWHLASLSNHFVKVLQLHEHILLSSLNIVLYICRRMAKPTKWPVHLTKTQISLGIHPGWSESSLSAWRNLGFLATHWAHSEDSDRSGRMPRLISVFAGHIDYFVGFVMRTLIFVNETLPYILIYTSIFFYNKPTLLKKHCSWELSLNPRLCYKRAGSAPKSKWWQIQTLFWQLPIKQHFHLYHPSDFLNKNYWTTFGLPSLICEVILQNKILRKMKAWEKYL